MSPTSSEQLKNNLIVLLVLVSLGLLAYAGIQVYASLSGKLALNTRLEAAEGQSITLTGAPGETLWFSVHLVDSVQGYWAAPRGLVLTFADPNAPGNPIQAKIAPKTNDWGGSISFEREGEKHEVVIVESLLVLPDSLPPGTILHGRLLGALEYPQAVGYGMWGGPGFDNKTLPLDLSVNLAILSPAELRWAEAKAIFQKVGFAFLGGLLGLGLFVGLLKAGRR